MNYKEFDNYTIGTCLLAGIVGGERFLKSSLLKDSNLIIKQVSLQSVYEGSTSYIENDGILSVKAINEFILKGTDSQAVVENILTAKF